MIAFTIVSLAYLPHARVLAKTYAAHHKGDKLWVLLIDDTQNTVIDEDEPFNVLRVQDLPLDRAELHRMALLFGSKLIATIKPWVFRRLMAEGAECVLYIDGDFVIYDSLEGMAQPDGGVILVPHVLSPLPRDGMDPDETSLLGSGLYNAGMFGVCREHGGFLEFLMERLQRECIFDPRKMRFNEQRWLDFVPVLFPHTIVRDSGIDVAYWNLHERPLSREGEHWMVGGERLRAFHFSSFDPRGKHAGGRYEWIGNPRVRVDTEPLLGQLCDEYGSMLYAEGFADHQDRPFAFDMLPDGTPVYETLRVLFRDAVLKADAGLGIYPPDPFDPSSRGEFDDWVAQQYEHAELSIPRQLSDRPARAKSISSPERGSSVGSRLRTWIGTRDIQNEAPEPESRRSLWAVDLVDRMILGQAGARSPTAIEILPECSGFVCHGPRIAVGAGSYSVTLEFDGQPVGAGVSQLDQALVFEGFVQGYAVGSMAATFADLSSGALVLGVRIPDQFVRESILYGLELRVLTRGRVHGRIAAVVLESIDAVRRSTGSACPHHEWLPVMAAGESGRRAGTEVVATSGAVGVVVSGPNWRLSPGRYRTVVKMRLGSDDAASDGLPARAPIASVEVSANDKVLGATTLTADDIRHGSTDLAFVVEQPDSAPDVAIGVRIRSLTGVDFVVSSVEVDRTIELSEANESVA